MTDQRKSDNLSLFNALTQYQSQAKHDQISAAQIIRQKDGQLQAIISQLLLLEAKLRKEQKEIMGQLSQRDMTIMAQRMEIDKLRRKNRRLINRLKKFSSESREAQRCSIEQRSKANHLNANEPLNSMNRIHDLEGYLSANLRSSDNNNSHKTYSSSNGRDDVSSNFNNNNNSQMIQVASSVSQLINNNKVMERHSSNLSKPVTAVNPNVASVRATTNRITHKPPIAEKPRIVNANKYGKVNAFLVRPPTAFNVEATRQCNIVSTIHRLLEEESDGTTGSSEPSSPEATLKPATPRVIKLARRFDREMLNCNRDSRPNTTEYMTQMLDNDDKALKAIIMDEHEVTSGYNSDAVSEHEYENVQVQGQGSMYIQPTDDDKDTTTSVLHHNNDYCNDNRYLDNTTMEKEDNKQIPDDAHVYSNVDFNSVTNHQTILSSQSESDDSKIMMQTHNNKTFILETNIDSSMIPSSQDDNGCVNVPRSRSNISLIIDTQGDHMTDNFEEFTLDSLELDEMDDDDIKSNKENCFPSSEMRHCGDGAETKNLNNTDDAAQNHANILLNQSYEKFLEATGLSQKSILTPTRIFSNHRSVLKPRDIKHRDKLRAAFTTLSTLEESPSTSPTNSTSSSASSSSFKYWTEPYL